MMNQIIHFSFLTYTLLLVVRIISSWIPELATQPWMAIIGQLTDPYLNLFRRFIPPIGGVLDLSPIVAFLALQAAEQLLRAIFK